MVYNFFLSDWSILGLKWCASCAVLCGILRGFFYCLTFDFPTFARAYWSMPNYAPVHYEYRQPVELPLDFIRLQCTLHDQCNIAILHLKFCMSRAEIVKKYAWSRENKSVARLNSCSAKNVVMAGPVGRATTALSQSCREQPPVH